MTIRPEAERRVDFRPPPAFKPEWDDLFGLRDPLPALAAEVLASGAPVGLQNLVNGYLMQPEAAGELAYVETIAPAPDNATTRARFPGRNRRLDFPAR